MRRSVFFSWSPSASLVAALGLSLWVPFVLVSAGESVAASSQEKEAPERYGFGRPASEEEIERLDIDVMPDGTGLPEGDGTVAEGAEVFAAKCAWCHGDDGTGGTFDVLVGRDPRGGFPFGEERGLT